MSDRGEPSHESKKSEGSTNREKNRQKSRNNKETSVDQYPPLIDIYQHLKVDSSSDLIKNTEPECPIYQTDFIDEVNADSVEENSSTVFQKIQERLTSIKPDQERKTSENAPLLMMYVENTKALFDCMPEKRTPLSLGLLKSSAVVLDKMIDETVDLLIEESIKEINDINFRRQICPEDSPPRFDDGDLSRNESVFAIKTNYNAVNEYVQLLVDFIMESFSNQVLENYNRGTQIDRRDMLRALREYASRSQEETGLFLSDIDMDNKYFQEEPTVESLLDFRLLSDHVYECLKQEVIVSNFYQVYMEDSDELAHIANIQKVFHKAIFDCFNEVASSFWSRDMPIDFNYLVMANRQILPRRLINKDDLEKVLLYSKEVVLEYASLLCGVIQDKEDSMMVHLKLLDSNTVSMIREERLIKMLAIDVG